MYQRGKRLTLSLLNSVNSEYLTMKYRSDIIANKSELNQLIKKQHEVFALNVIL